MQQFILILFVVFCSFFVVPTSYAAYEVDPAAQPLSLEPAIEVVTVVKVIDGDSIIVKDGNGKTKEIRLIGVDTPETFKQLENPRFRCYAQHSKQYLHDLLLNKNVLIERETSEVDKYGRFLRHVMLNGENVSKRLLTNGYARVFSVAPDRLYISQFIKWEQEAKNKRAGIWSEACGDQIVTSFGGGASPEVLGFNKNGSAKKNPHFFGYSKNFLGGTSIATGDINGDFDDEIIVGAGKGGGPQVRVFNKDGSLQGLQFFAFHPDFRGGINVASGDVNDDGKSDIAVAQASGGQSWVKVYRHDGRLLAYFNAFGAPEIGASIALGDVDRDGKDELIVGAGKGGGPHIRVYDIGDGLISGINQGAKLKPIQFFAFDKNNRSGVHVAAGDVDADGKDEIGVCQGAGDQAWCKVYRYNVQHSLLGEWMAYPDTNKSGAYISMGDIDYDGRAEVITGAGESGGPQVRTFEADGEIIHNGFFVGSSNFRGGIHVQLGRFWKDVK